VRAGAIEAITISDGLAVMPLNIDMDIIKLNRQGISVQSASGGKIKIFTEINSGIQELEIPPGLHNIRF
jgi:hypothetical protein